MALLIAATDDCDNVKLARKPAQRNHFVVDFHKITVLFWAVLNILKILKGTFIAITRYYTSVC